MDEQELYKMLIEQKGELEGLEHIDRLVTQALAVLDATSAAYAYLWSVRNILGVLKEKMQ